MNSPSMPKSVSFPGRENLEGPDVDAKKVLLASENIIILGAQQGLGISMEAESQAS